MGFLDTITQIFNPLGNELSGISPFLDPTRQVNKALSHTFSSPPANTSANDLLAKLYNQEWTQYLQAYAPQEELQLGLISDAGNAQERQQALASAAAPYSGGQPLAQVKRQALAYGTKLTPEQVQSFNQQTNLQQGASQVDAYNRTATAQTDRAFGVIGQGAYQPGGSIQNPIQLVPGG